MRSDFRSLLPELRAGSGNEVLVQLDRDWKSRQFGRIHRFCAIEIRRMYLSHVPDVSGIVVPYFSGSYGCDSSVPVDRIDGNHETMVKTSDRTGPGNEAYLVLLRNYRENAYTEWRVASDPARDYSHYFQVDCNHTEAHSDYKVTFPLIDAYKEELVEATAEWRDTSNIKDVNPNPPRVKIIDRSTVSVNYGFNGLDKVSSAVPEVGMRHSWCIRPSVHVFRFRTGDPKSSIPDYEPTSVEIAESPQLWRCGTPQFRNSATQADTVVCGIQNPRLTPERASRSPQRPIAKTLAAGALLVAISADTAEQHNLLWSVLTGWRRVLQIARRRSRRKLTGTDEGSGLMRAVPAALGVVLCASAFGQQRYRFGITLSQLSSELIIFFHC